MKKITLLILFTLLVILFTACGKKSEVTPQALPPPGIPFTRGPTSPPHISEPTYPPPP